MIGSAPSAIQYKDLGYGATIAINGASRLLERVKHGRYFLSGDAGASRKSYYARIPERTTHILRPMAAVYSPIFIPDRWLRVRLATAWEKYLDEHPDEVRIIPNRTVRRGAQSVPLRDLEYDNPFYDELLRRLPPCGPHVAFNVTLPQPLATDMQKLRRGPTSSGCALQLAYLMGASSIDMYGVEMTNQGVSYAAGNYFYEPLQDERGVTSASQLESIELVVRDLQVLGVEVRHSGPTRIRDVRIIGSHQGSPSPGGRSS